MLSSIFAKKFSICFSFLFTIIALTTIIFTDIQIFAQVTVPEFTPDYVLSDDSFRSTRAFPTQQSVQDFLDRINSPLKNFRHNNKLASQIIFEAARGVTSSQYGYTPQINPGVMLAYLEKEMSLVSDTSYNANTDPQGRIQKAMGYGCPDIGGCDLEYQGFTNQLNWGALQLEINFITANPSSPKKIQPYVSGSKITTLDGYTFVISNQATAACYRYTPHVFYGCYNLWKIVTANGWGVSAQRYLYDDLDKANIGKTPKTTVTVENISEQEGQKLIFQSYNLGQNDLTIRNLQKYLKQNNYFNGQNISSIFDRSTGDSLRKFIMDKNLANPEFKIESNPNCKSLLLQDYTVGTENSTIKQMQLCLIEYRVFDIFNNTGYYGQITNKAHKYIQALIQKTTTNPNVNGQGNSPTPVPPVSVESTNNQPTQANCEVIGRNFVVGQMDDDVIKLQGCLKARGIFQWPSGVTGYYGEYTNGLYTQIVGQLQCSAVKSQKWGFGERSIRVKRLQECLKAEGKFDYPLITGYLGPITWRGLKS